MRIGLFYFPVDYGIGIVELASALEDRGFGSLYVPEHTHIPTNGRRFAVAASCRSAIRIPMIPSSRSASRPRRPRS